MIADIWSALARNEIALGVLLLVALATVYVLIVTAIKVTRDTFGRRPPVDDDLRNLRAELAGLAPQEKVDKLIEQFGAYAKAADVDKIREELKGYVDQAQFDRRMTDVARMIERMEKQHEAQIKEMRIYVHTEVHGFRNEANAWWTRADAQREGLHSRMNIFAEALAEVRGWVRAQEGEQT